MGSQDDNLRATCPLDFLEVSQAPIHCVPQMQRTLIKPPRGPAEANVPGLEERSTLLIFFGEGEV